MSRSRSSPERALVAAALVGAVACAPPACPAAVAPALAAAAPGSRTTAPAAAIVQIGAPVVRRRAEEVPRDRLGTPELSDLVGRMIRTMRAAPGVGLAAPQIGVPWRVIVLEDREELLAKLPDEDKKERERVAFGPRVFINPVLRKVGDERATFFEGCLSVRGYVGLVERDLEVEVEGIDADGAPQKWRVRGWPARILQHEVDHLDGTLYVDRVVPRSFMNADAAKEHFGGKPIAEVRRLIDGR